LQQFARRARLLVVNGVEIRLDFSRPELFYGARDGAVLLREILSRENFTRLAVLEKERAALRYRKRQAGWCHSLSV
jgi:hypothetical protein